MKNGQLTAGLARSGARAGEKSRLAEDSGAARAAARRTARPRDRDVDGNETSGLRLPDQALPIASFTGWNAVKEKAPGACTAGAALPFPQAARRASAGFRPHGDTPSLPSGALRRNTT